MWTNTDLSRWHKLNPAINIVPTSKKFYGRYSHKMVFTVANSYLITKYGGTTLDWLTAKPQSGSDNLDTLRCFRNVLRDPESGFRLRSEGSTLGVFHTDIDFMYDTVINKLRPHAHRLKLVNTVTSQAQYDALENNYIVTNQPTEYPWRVYVRDGFYRDFKERVALAAYLENIGDQARVSKYFIKDLRGANKYLKGNYFHVKDPRLVDMLHLIMPKIVRSVQQVVTIST